MENKSKHDEGFTSTYVGGCIAKDGVITEVNGTIDELSSHLGFCRTLATEDLFNYLLSIQTTLAWAGSQISTSGRTICITTNEIDALKHMIDHFGANLEPLRKFIIPGGSQLSAALHVARTVNRRLERRLVTLSKEIETDKAILTYFNKLSDVLFIMARYASKRDKQEEYLW